MTSVCPSPAVREARRPASPAPAAPLQQSGADGGAIGSGAGGGAAPGDAHATGEAAPEQPIANRRRASVGKMKTEKREQAGDAADATDGGASVSSAASTGQQRERRRERREQKEEREEQKGQEAAPKRRSNVLYCSKCQAHGEVAPLKGKFYYPSALFIFNILNMLANKNLILILFSSYI